MTKPTKPQASRVDAKEAPDRPVAIATSRAIWLVAILLAGLLLVVGLKALFTYLQDDLSQRSTNERARLFIGEEIVRGIQSIERDVFYMSSLTSDGAINLVERQIAEHVEKLRHDLDVLKTGGTVRQTINLNIEGHDQMLREMRYQPEQGLAYVMEIIEIGPLIEEIDLKTRGLRALLDQRIAMRAAGDDAGFFKVEQLVGAHLKHLPPFFFRLNENANRLLFESNERLGRLEKDIEIQRERYRYLETLSIILVIVVATLTGLLFAGQIRDANHRLRQAWEAMRAAKEEAERASRAKSDFVSRMSHELRTPMNAILGFAQLLKDEELNHVQRDYINEINRAGVHLLELINQVLDLAKIEAGHMTLERIEFDPMLLVDEVAMLVTERAREKGLSTRFFASPKLPARILGDPTRLRQVLINLVGNAVKFTDTGFIDLRVAPTEDGQRLRFEIEDTGIGVDQATLSRLFKAFSQADESTTRKYGGTGLGLLISKELVEAMGGHLEVDSAPGRGSRFRFSLPTLVAPGAEARPTPLTGYRALLLCEETHLSEVLTAYLGALGAEVVSLHATDTDEKLESLPDQPCIVIGGGDCLARMRGWLANRTARLVFLKLPGDDSPSADHDATLVEPVTYTRMLGLAYEISARHAATPNTGAQAPSVKAGKARKARMLLVEDNRINQIVAARMLEKLGLACDIAVNGREALEMLVARPYDLVLMDVQMPVLDGIEATVAWREMEPRLGRARTTIIAMTADAMTEDREKCLASGMDDHVAKPIDLSVLSDTLNRWLPGRGMQAV